MTYNYDTGKITRDWVMKRMGEICRHDPDRPCIVGVECSICPHYWGERKFYSKDLEFLGRFVFCKFHKEDDEGTKELVWKMMDEFKEEAITHYYD